MIQSLSSARGVGGLLLVIFLTGFWLALRGRPFNTFLLTLHKLISLAALVLFFIYVNRAYQAAALSRLSLALSLLTGLFFLSAIVSGGLVSLDRPMPRVVLILHRASPFLAAIAAALVFLRV